MGGCDRAYVKLQSLNADEDRLLSWLEELDWISVGIFYPDLSAKRTSLHLIAKLYSGILPRVDMRREVHYAQDHSIPSARPLGFPAGIGRDSEAPGPLSS